MLHKKTFVSAFCITVGLLISGLCAKLVFQKKSPYWVRFIPECKPEKVSLLRNTGHLQIYDFDNNTSLFKQATRVKPVKLDSFFNSYQYYRIEIQSHSLSLVLNFFNHEEVELCTVQGHKIPRLTAWHFSKGHPNQKRYIAFRIEPASASRVFYFLVFHRHQFKDPQIQLLSQSKFENQLYRDYYHKGNFILLTWLWLGIGIFQLAYVANLLWSRQGVEYVWYLLFLLIGAYDFFNARRYELGISHWPIFLPTYIYNIHAIITYCYFRFVRLYLSTANQKPSLDFQLKTVEGFLLACFATNLLLYNYTQRLDITIAFRDVTLVVVGIANLYLLWRFYRLGSPLVIYLLIGASIIIFSSVVQHVNQLLLEHGYVQQLVFTDNFTTLGGILDFVCLNIGLNYKHRQENLKLQQAVVKERDRIAQEFHDKAKGLLGLITTISQRAQGTTPNEIPDTALKAFEQIEKNSKKVIKEVREIIWMLDSRNDNLEKLFVYLYDTAQEFLQHLTDCPISIPPANLTLNKQVVPAAHRRQIALAFVETLQNILKHAQTERAQIKVELNGDVLRIMVRDFGRGFEPLAPILTGNGLTNLQKRMTSIGGIVHIESKNGEGTTVILQYAINKK